MGELTDIFQSIGLSEAKAKDTIKNTALSATLNSLIQQVVQAPLLSAALFDT